MSEQANDLNFQAVGINTNVGTSPDALRNQRQRSWVNAHFKRPQITTGYGLNEPQWTLANDIPPLIHYRSPYARVPLPPMFRIHPVLSFRKQPAVDWTIDQPPDTATLSVGYMDPDTYHWKSAPATNPPALTPLTIYIECLDFQITVSPGGTVVTVGDVLMAIYVGARRCVTERMLAHIGLKMRIMEGLDRSMGEIPRTRNCTMGDDEVCSNVRESANYLTEWVGLAPSAKDDDTWCLYTQHLAR